MPTFPVDGLLALTVTAPVATMPVDGTTGGLDEENGRREFEAAREELVRRLAAEPGVAGVTISSVRPGAGVSTQVVVDGPAAVDPPPALVSTVDPSYFDVFQVPLLVGRSFEPGDQQEGASAVIVNRAFARRILGTEQALGRRFQLPGIAPEGGPVDGPTYEIVGIVEDMFVRERQPDVTTPAVYRPHRPGLPVGMITVRTRGTMEEIASRVREIAMDVLPAGSGVEISPMASAYFGAPQEDARGLLVSIISLITLSVLLLAAAGISALMSFAVTQRQREIGIRTALGAPRGRIIASIFSRACRQVGTGLVVGAVLACGLDWLAGGELLEGSAGVILPLVCLLMLTAGLVASVGPARRALRIQPIDALRQE